MPLAVDGMKECIKCKVIKPVAEYSKRTVSKDGLKETCKPCCKESNAKYFASLPKEELERRDKRNKEWRVANRHKLRPMWTKSRLKRIYGLTVAQYAEMLKQQNDGCAICGKAESTTVNGRIIPLSVDHDHTTGKVRELLCTKCNNGLGWFHDNPELLCAALNYLLKHKTTNYTLKTKE